MVEAALKKWNSIINKAPKLLMTISEENMSLKSSENKWSKKEILGHLIDSATNNHQRFVRAQFESNLEINYDQNKWNAYNFYQDMESIQLIQFWTSYNRQLIEICKRIPKENLVKEVNIGESLITLEFLLVQYIEHLEHHLKQLIKI